MKNKKRFKQLLNHQGLMNDEGCSCEIRPPGEGSKQTRGGGSGGSTAVTLNFSQSRATTLEPTVCITDLFHTFKSVFQPGLSSQGYGFSNGHVWM